jgi:hypothetical protein
MERKGVVSVSAFTRTEQFLEKTIGLLEDLASSSALTSGQLEGMMDKLHGIRLAMRRLDKTIPSERARFWKMSRRAVSITVKIARLLSGS